jgi:hypothetical protein
VKLYCEHRIARDAQELWAVLHTPAFEKRLARAIGLAEYSELERAETSEAFYRKIRVVPHIPSSFHSLLRRVGVEKRVSYIEEQWRSKEAKEVRWKMTPSLLADRTRIEGRIRIKPLDAGSCLRVLDGTVNVRLPGIGRAIERAIVSGALEAYERSAQEASRRP